MVATAKLMTEEEFAAYAARHGRCELIEGRVRKLSPTGSNHGRFTARLHLFIHRYVFDHDLGEVLAAETGFRLDDNGQPTVRAPDVAFVSKARAAELDTPKFARIAPDLVVETLSPDDRAGEVAEKIAWWLRHGVRLVWVLDPEHRRLTAYLPDASARVHEAVDTLEGRDVLPGFQLPLDQLFR